MIKQLNRMFGKLNQAVGVSVPLPNPGKKVLKTVSLCHLIVGTGLLATSVIVSSKRCAVLAGLSIANSIVLRLER